MSDLACWNFGGRPLAFAATIFMCVATVAGCSEKPTPTAQPIPTAQPTPAPAPGQAKRDKIAVRDVPSAETAAVPKATKATMKRLTDADIEQAEKALAAHGIKFHMYSPESGKLEFKREAFGDDGSIRPEGLQELKALLPFDFALSVDLSAPKDVTISQLAELPYINKVYLRRTKDLTDASMVSLSKLPRLKGLALSDASKITDTGLAEFANMEQLEWLLINTSGVTTDGSFLAGLDKHPALKELNIGAESLTDDAFGKLTSLPALENLSIMPCRLTGEGLVFLKRCPQLQSLSLDLCVGLSDVAFDSLAAEAPLEKVFIRGASKGAGLKLTDKSLQSLAQFKTLTHLRLIDCPSITNDGVKAISSLSNLEELQLDHCKQIGDAAMPHIAAHENLKSLELVGTAITGDGLKYLTPMKNLFVINASKTAVTADDVQAIKEQMPGLKNIHIGK